MPISVAGKALISEVSKELGLPVFTVYHEYLRRTLSTTFNPEAISNELLEHYWGDSGRSPQFFSISEPSHVARLEASLDSLTRERKIRICLFARARRDVQGYKIYDSRLRRQLCSEVADIALTGRDNDDDDDDEGDDGGGREFCLAFEVKRALSTKSKKQDASLELVKMQSHADIPPYKIAYLMEKGSSFTRSQGCFLRDARKLFRLPIEDLPSEVPRISALSDLAAAQQQFRRWVCGDRGLILTMHDGIGLGARRRKWSESEIFENPDNHRFRVILVIKPVASESENPERAIASWKAVPVISAVEGGFILLDRTFASRVINSRIPNWKKEPQWRSLEARHARDSLMRQRSHMMAEWARKGSSNTGRKLSRRFKNGHGDNNNNNRVSGRPPSRSAGERAKKKGCVGRGGVKVREKRKRDFMQEARWPCSCSHCKKGAASFWGNMDYFGPQKMYKTNMSTFQLLKYLNLDTADTLSKVDKSLNSSIVAFDIESYTRKFEEMSDGGLSAPGLTSEEIGGGGRNDREAASAFHWRSSRFSKSRRGSIIPLQGVCGAESRLSEDRLCLLLPPVCPTGEAGEEEAAAFVPSI